MRSSYIEIGVGEYYHLYSRGVLKQKIFLDRRDYIRFLFLILHFQSPVNLFNLSRPTTSFVRSQTFNIANDTIQQIIKQRTVGLNVFCLMPNHFHLIVQEVETGGIAKFMHRTLTAYAKYFNTKYQRTGHLFESAYQIVPITDNNQLLYVSAYVHKNPVEIAGDYQNYQWSSFQDYTVKNRWDKLLDQEIISEQFTDTENEYATWVKNTTAKELKENLEDLPGLLDVLDV